MSLTLWRYDTENILKYAIIKYIKNIHVIMHKSYNPVKRNLWTRTT